RPAEKALDSARPVLIPIPVLTWCRHCTSRGRLPMTLPVVLFALVAAGTAGSALGVVLSGSIVRAAVWLLFTLIGVSLVYFLVGADFLGAAQLIVYEGGTLVLVVFGVMLTTQGPFAGIRTKPA